MLRIQHFRLTLSCPLYDLESSWSVIYITILSLDLASTTWDKFNEPKIIMIGHLETELFYILILGSKSIDSFRNIVFSVSLLLIKPLVHLGTLSFKIDTRKQWYWVASTPAIPKTFSSWALEKLVFLNRL